GSTVVAQDLQVRVLSCSASLSSSAWLSECSTFKLPFRFAPRMMYILNSDTIYLDESTSHCYRLLSGRSSWGVLRHLSKNLSERSLCPAGYRKLLRTLL